MLGKNLMKNVNLVKMSGGLDMINKIRDLKRMFNTA